LQEKSEPKNYEFPNTRSEECNQQAALTTNNNNYNYFLNNYKKNNRLFSNSKYRNTRLYIFYCTTLCTSKIHTTTSLCIIHMNVVHVIHMVMPRCRANRWSGGIAKTRLWCWRAG